MNNKQGFTLVELLIIIAIIGIMSVLTVVNLTQLKYKAKDSVRIASVRQLQSALEIYYYAHDEYPPASVGVGGACVCQYEGNPCPDADVGYVDICRSTQNDWNKINWIPALYDFLGQDLPIDPINYNEGNNCHGGLCGDRYFGYARVNSNILVNGQPRPDKDSYIIWYWREGDQQVHDCGAWGYIDGEPAWSNYCVTRDPLN